MILQAPESLAVLLRDCTGVQRVFTPGQALPPFDVHAPLLSLPGLCGTRLDNVPAPIPYLRVSPERRAWWRQRLGDGGAFTVGVVWRGNPQFAGDHHRSARLAEMRALGDVPGIRFVSLQKGPGSEQLADLGGAWLVEDLGTQEWSDFAETAAFVANLDLVISVDTAAAHLGGALGVPVWLALSYASDWRWLLGREDTPWYPGMRLFRQRRRRDWPEVFARMAEALLRLAAVRFCVLCGLMGR